MAQLVKNPPAMRETWVWSLGWEDPLEKGMATHSSILTWRPSGHKELDTTEWLLLSLWDFASDSVEKNVPVIQEMLVWSLGEEDPPEKEMAPYSSILVWEIPWVEESGRLQSMESQRVGHDWATYTNTWVVRHLLTLSLWDKLCTENTYIKYSYN